MTIQTDDDDGDDDNNSNYNNVKIQNTLKYRSNRTNG